MKLIRFLLGFMIFPSLVLFVMGIDWLGNNHPVLFALSGGLSVCTLTGFIVMGRN